MHLLLLLGLEEGGREGEEEGEGERERGGKGEDGY
jgi:hypothetical protein